MADDKVDKLSLLVVRVLQSSFRHKNSLLLTRHNKVVIAISSAFPIKKENTL